MTILIVRHGQTRFNLENKIQGRLDSPLTLRGIEESRTAAATIRKFVANDPEHLLFASPQGRAVETMEIVRQHLGLASPVQVDERLAEVGLGSWEGRTYGECVNADAREVPVSGIATAWALCHPIGELKRPGFSGGGFI
jgi:broad specificity phosphatase PhoE